MPIKYYTEEEYLDLIKNNHALESLIKSISSYYKYKDELKRGEELRMKETTPMETSDPNLARWYYIPLNLGWFLSDLTFLTHYYKKKKASIYDKLFVDAGCGIGITVKLASYFGFRATGIEICKENYEIANNIFGSSIILGDILEVDYSKYDIVYYYCPIYNSKLQREFELKVEKELKVGGIIIAHNKQDGSIIDNPQFKALSKHNPIWLKKNE